MTNLYPAFLDLNGCRVVFIGGGRIAERRIAGLLSAGAKVHVISPTVTMRIQQWLQDRTICGELRAYRSGDTEGAKLVFIATDQPGVNEQVREEACQKGIWVNDISDQTKSGFHVPATVKRGGLQIAVSTAGASPMLAGRIAKLLEDQYPNGYGKFVDFMRIIRDHTGAGNLSSQLRHHIYEYCLDRQDEILNSLSYRTGKELAEKIIYEQVSIWPSLGKDEDRK